ncbi:cupredoxin-like protein [Synechococcus sp. RS9909]|uniref:multicopper oxidase family protein n=1 Tax=unclassified Synechococcus TaxID=2626047 RepID=UPI0000690CA3|nr:MULTISPECIES: multicopper oxidase family protein [unclassified Synechococcus]EAQ67893.1 laccase [Synechococcus sp. RS9917]QNI79284.1 cupredoxin-like protein [Synechococcus sp. RS9909]
MNRRSFLALTAGGAAAASAGLLGQHWLSRAGQVSPVMSQPVVRSSQGALILDLVAQETRITIPGTAGRALTYNGLLPGPVLEFNAGDDVKIQLHNRLNQPTNLHYHGLHVSPEGNADNVFLSVQPGASQSYSFQIPDDHPAGLFYYHPHHHGTVSDQVFGGLGGALIVRGELDRIPEVQSAQEEVLFLKDLPADRQPGMGGAMLGREGSVLTVNGQVNPTIEAPAGGLLRLRLVNGSNARFWRLALEGQRLHLIATDGGALEQPLAIEDLLLVPGARADVLVQISPTGGQFRLRNRSYNRVGRRMMGMRRMVASSQGEETIATIQTHGTTTPVALPRELLPIQPLNNPVRTRRFVMNHGMAPSMGMMFLINGQPYDHQRIDTRVRLGDIEEWDLVNTGVMDHPFHVHVNPMQVISRNGEPERLLAWRDVVLVRAGETVRVRTQFRDFSGRSVYHCHILDHEDLGMMGNLLIEA